MASNRIKGRGLTFTIDDVDYQCDATSVVLGNEESDSDSDNALTFCDAVGGAGVREWKFTISAIQSTDPTSFWTYLWDNSGTQGVSYLFAPHANETATEAQPHFVGTVDLPQKPDIGGEANTTWTFDIEIPTNEEPTKVTS